MLLLNSQKLEVAAAEKDKNHPLHEQALFYLKSTEYLRKTYGKYMRFVDIKQPRYCKGSDGRGNDIPKMKEPDTIMRIPLQTYYADPKRGREVWACCTAQPVLLPNGLWDLGRNRSLTIKGEKIVDLTMDVDLAFYLAYLSPFVRKKLLKIDNPAMDAKSEGDRNRELTKRKTAIWNMLDDEKLRIMASAYGVTQTTTKTTDRIRLDLEKILEINDKLKKSNPAVRGTDDFLEEMKVTDGLLLRAFTQNAIDNKQVTWTKDGKWHIGEKVVFHVSLADVQNKREFDALCNYLSAPNNNDKLQDFLQDLVSKEYLDSVKDPKVFNWLATNVKIKTAFKKKGEVKRMVYDFFCGGDSSGSDSQDSEE